MKMQSFLALAVLCGSLLAAAEQKPAQKLADAGEARVEYVSPDVHADRTVGFHLAAPQAASVKVHLGNKDYSMTKEADGWWSVTVGPVAPEIYTYNYVIDGANMYAVMDGDGLDNRIVEVPGSSEPRYDELQDVPHGAIVLHTYTSKVQGRERHFRVYLPPDYYTEPERKFPVLYLFNGFDDVQWTSIGKVNVVLDNLIAQNKAVPMIIVMPFNRIHGEDVAQVAPFAAQAKTPEERAGLASSLDTIAVFEKELPDEIMPIVERNYRTINDRDHRAIAGLSFGGGTAFGLATRHPDMYAYLGEFATGTFGGTQNPPSGYVGYGPWIPDRIAPHMLENMQNPATHFKLFYMAVGQDDPRKSFQVAAYEQFKAAGVQPLVFEALPGAHEYKFFRRAMADFVTMIFK
jgi:enterochelin esterase family protein